MNQVENLRQIAEEFSNFGSLPKTNNEKILLNDIVETIHDLFRKRDDMEIKLIEPIDDIRVYADKNHLVRILNNLVKNSIQAIPTDRKGEIELKLWKDGTKAIIRVRDNGIGISDEMQTYIFKPKFTTKSSGSGLGLAIAANMVDSIGGSIYFKSVENKGTDFFVELPLVRSTFSDDLERVTL
jgi:signal transduction histidine kinase